MDTTSGPIASVITRKKSTMRQRLRKHQGRFDSLHIVQQWHDLPIVRRAQLNGVSEPTQNRLDRLSEDDHLYGRAQKKYGMSYIVTIQHGIMSIQYAYLAMLGAPDSLLSRKHGPHAVSSRS